MDNRTSHNGWLAPDTRVACTTAPGLVTITLNGEIDLLVMESLDNALTTAGWGLTSAEHYYGLPEALFEDRVVQNFPLDYDYNDDYFRFSVSGQKFRQGCISLSCDATL